MAPFLGNHSESLPLLRKETFLDDVLAVCFVVSDDGCACFHVISYLNGTDSYTRRQLNVCISF